MDSKKYLLLAIVLMLPRSLFAQTHGAPESEAAPDVSAQGIARDTVFGPFTVAWNDALRTQLQTPEAKQMLERVFPEMSRSISHLERIEARASQDPALKIKLSRRGFLKNIPILAPIAFALQERGITPENFERSQDAAWKALLLEHAIAAGKMLTEHRAQGLLQDANRDWNNLNALSETQADMKDIFAFFTPYLSDETGVAFVSIYERVQHQYADMHIADARTRLARIARASVHSDDLAAVPAASFDQQLEFESARTYIEGSDLFNKEGLGEKTPAEDIDEAAEQSRAGIKEGHLKAALNILLSLETSEPKVSPADVPLKIDPAQKIGPESFKGQKSEKLPYFAIVSLLAALSLGLLFAPVINGLMRLSAAIGTLVFAVLGLVPDSENSGYLKGALRGVIRGAILTPIAMGIALFLIVIPLGMLEGFISDDLNIISVITLLAGCGFFLAPLPLLKKLAGKGR